MPAMRLSGALRYLGRNPAYGPEVKTIPYDKQLEFADKILSTGKGDCYNFAAVFCLLARKLGYLATPIVGECGYSWNWYPIAHGWVEIELDGETFLFDRRSKTITCAPASATRRTAPGR